MSLFQQPDRYERQRQLLSFGAAAQERISSSKICVVGAGGLGAPLLLYLATAGVGSITIIDSDQVELSNLHRQILYRESDIGSAKAMCAAQRLREHNSEISITVHQLRLDHSNALELLADTDLVIDCSDSFDTRYCINDACVLLGHTLLSASVRNRELHVGVYNALSTDGKRGASLRCVYPTAPPSHLVSRCEDDGILGSVCALAASIMTDCALQILGGLPCALNSKFIYFSLDTMQSQVFSMQRNEQSWPASAKSQQDFLSLAESSEALKQSLQELNVSELSALLASPAPPLVICLSDVAVQDNAVNEVYAEESFLYRAASQLLAEAQELDENQLMVLCCTRGIRSQTLVSDLRSHFPSKNIASLRGGMTAWREWKSQESLSTTPSCSQQESQNTGGIDADS